MYQCSTEAKKGRVNSSTRGEAPSGGIEKFPKSHERHIPIPPRVEKYPHEWVTKSPRMAKPRVVNFVTHEWGYFATSGGIEGIQRKFKSWIRVWIKIVPCFHDSVRMFTFFTHKSTVFEFFKVICISITTSINEHFTFFTYFVVKKSWKVSKAGGLSLYRSLR